MSGIINRMKSVLRRDGRKKNQSGDLGRVKEGQPYGESASGTPQQTGPESTHHHSTQGAGHHSHPDHPTQHHPNQQPIQQHQGSTHHGGGVNITVPTTPATQSGTLLIELRNESESDTVYAYVTGQAIDNGNALFLLSSDAKTPYYPASPSYTGAPIGADISIPLGAPGNIVQAQIPFIAGGRVWFSVGTPLVFSLNPGPALVEPSVFNPSDPNINTHFGFCEFTFNSAQLFANISYVDFVGEPIALTMRSSNGAQQHVSGIPRGGMGTIAQGLRAQTAQDGQPWSSLIVNNSSGQLLRVLSPNSGILLNPTWFENYWTNYVNEVYAKYATAPLTVDTQASYGDVNGTTGGSNAINFGAGGSFAKPSAADIFSNSTGPFATGSDGETNAIIPRLAAAFNRSTLLLSNNQPDGVHVANYYTNPVTNHYAKIVHAANLDGHGYAFPYDDVTPDGGVPQEGAIFSGDPTLWTIAVGGGNPWTT